MRAIAYWDIQAARIKAVRRELEYCFDLRIAATLGELRDLLAKVRLDALLLGPASSDPPVLAEDLKALARDALCPVFALVDGDFIHSRVPGIFLIGTADLPRLSKILLSAMEGDGASTSEDEPIFVGRSEAMRKVAVTVRKYAQSEHPVLVIGETGTGKELVANALHALSPRRRAPFVALNCAAIPESLVESELFGTAKGAFTDAIRRDGAFRKAAGGTLFLDEIGSMSLSIQPKLLRALESGEYWPLGANEPERSRFRLVCATWDNLVELSSRGLFRRDLIYRIADLVVEIPPLRERPDDIDILAEHFCSLAGMGLCSLGPAALDKLKNYTWPGNVRELRSVVNRACADVQTGTIGPDAIVFLAGLSDRARRTGSLPV
ncbi:MAG TPA: sigma-54 dependent transcriptional regulator [Rectinemataceae bacterium]